MMVQAPLFPLSLWVDKVSFNKNHRTKWEKPTGSVALWGSIRYIGGRGGQPVYGTAKTTLMRVGVTIQTWVHLGCAKN